VQDKRPPVEDNYVSFLAESSSQGTAVRRPQAVRRRITPEAGRGLEKLGHALEYLTDEFVHDGCSVIEDCGRLQAIQILAGLNRQIYFACEVQPSIRARVQSLVRRFAH
jgi:hypothetical protein